MPLGILAFVAVLVALGVYVALRMRAGQPVGFTFRTVVLAYFSMMSIASFLVLAAGLTSGAKAGLSDALGREFSYFTPPKLRPAPPEGPGSGRGGELRPPSEEEQARNQRQVERQYQEDWIQAGSLVAVGSLLWALHLWGRRKAESQDEASAPFFRRASTTMLLAIAGIAGIISLPTGIYELLRYLLLPTDDLFSRQPPGSTLAMALVFVPIWLYYLLQALRRSGAEA
ncbi:MAG: hypothetical protein HYY02_00615 [Chloroflexi bacterium]|nr:hypothetical protein [Chloroflexota bacterium]